jgi:hypothetical protein
MIIKKLKSDLNFILSNGFFLISSLLIIFIIDGLFDGDEPI